MAEQYLPLLRRIEHAPQNCGALSAKPLNPRAILRAELPLEFGAQPRGQRRAFAASGDRDLQRAAPHNRRIVEIAIRRIVHGVAQNSAAARLTKNTAMKLGGRCRRNHQKSADKVRGAVCAPSPNDLLDARQTLDFLSCFGSHDFYSRAGLQETFNFGFRDRARTDHQTSAPRQLQKQREQPGLSRCAALGSCLHKAASPRSSLRIRITSSRL